MLVSRVNNVESFSLLFYFIFFFFGKIHRFRRQYAENSSTRSLSKFRINLRNFHGRDIFKCAQRHANPSSRLHYPSPFVFYFGKIKYLFLRVILTNRRLSLNISWRFFWTFSNLLDKTDEIFTPRIEMFSIIRTL